MKKRRPFQHIMEERSFVVLRNVLPQEWVVHEYRPDYGIDYVIEIFQNIVSPSKSPVAEALGELFFVQLKSVQKGKFERVRVSRRYNVEKLPVPQHSDDHLEIEILKFVIDVSELLLVQAMGASIPVLLVIVVLDTNRVFFLCLNDLIEKVIIPENPQFHKQKTKTVWVPTKNEITASLSNLIPLRFYAKRAKFCSAFSKFSYQARELCYVDVKMIRNFIAVIERYDFWESTPSWRIVESVWKDVRKLSSILNSEITETKKQQIYHEADFLWNRLCALNSNYEELCREWFLPTYFGQLMSYPD